MPADPWLVLGALALEAAIGYPAALHRRAPHPVVWIGGLIGRLEGAWNTPLRPAAARKALGVLSLLIAAGAAGTCGALIEHAPLPAPWSTGLVALAATLGLAQKSLFQHTAAIAAPLLAGDLPAARSAVGAVVGRDVHTLDEAGVAAAALESLAESFNDAVVAPAFWFLVAGLPGLFVFKAVNTADSMIGHMEPRWRAFGWAAARTDDAMNLVPARLAGAMIAFAAGRGWRTMLAEARFHASPNSGWPEAAMAGALRVRLGGATAYDGVAAVRAVFGAINPAPTATDLKRGLSLYIRACAVLWTALALGGLAIKTLG